jgi:hypothetical protein
MPMGDGRIRAVLEHFSGLTESTGIERSRYRGAHIEIL